MKKSILLALLVAPLLALTSCGDVYGDTGIQGEQGPIGEKGTMGPDGDSGSIGPVGEPGPTGEQGNQGEKGENGKSSFDIFMEANPNYYGDVEDYLFDLTNGLLYTQHTITLDSLDGSEYEPIKCVHRMKTIVNLPTLTKEGATFEGWSDGEMSYKDGDEIILLEDITLCASWN